MPSVGRVIGIWRYPVKSMGGESLDSCRVGKGGISGDRGWALRDAATGALLSAKRVPILMLCSAAYMEEPGPRGSPRALIAMPDGSKLRTDAADAARRLSDFLGRDVLLEFLSGQPRDGAQHFDAYPVHLVSAASLRLLGRMEPRAGFDVRRFRPNFLVETAQEEEAFVELAWRSRGLRLGSVAVRVEKATKRCVMTTLPQRGLPQDPAVLKTIVRDAGQNLGVYARVQSGGAVAVGDGVELL